MKTNKNQIAAVFIIIAFAVSLLAAYPTSNAQTTSAPKPTYAFIGTTPNPVGVGQEVLLHIGISEATAGTYFKWTGLTVTVTKPDNTTETLGPFSTDATGGTGSIYVPTMVGTYKFQTHFPAQTMAIAFAGVGAIPYAASDSPVTSLVVQQNPIQYFPAIPLPTEYWNRPINAQFEQWAPLTGNWLRAIGSYTMPPDDKYIPGNQGAPETAHILWNYQYAEGGLAGGNITAEGGGMEMGDAYVGKFLNTVVINGVLYFNRYDSTGAPVSEQTVVAINLKTGEELWEKNWNNTRLSFGQVFHWKGFNLDGTFAYLFTSTPVTGAFGQTLSYTWNAYDPLTGRWLYQLINVPAGNPDYNYYGPDGIIYRYTVDTTNGRLTEWNSSRAINPELSGSVADGSWTPIGSIIDARQGYDYNVSIPHGLPGAVCNAQFDDCVLGSTSSAFPGATGPTLTSWAISTKTATAGQLIFNTTWTVPSDYAQGTWVWSDVSFTDRVFIISCKESLRFYGFDLNTGNYIWQTEQEPYLAYYDKWYGPMIAYGLFYSERQSGMTIAYNIHTGQREWTYNCTDYYAQVLWSNNWPTVFWFATDGKLYLSYATHHPNLQAKGAYMTCLNATTGEVIYTNSWFDSWWGGTPVIGDGIIAGLNAGYDNRIYAFGKGATETTVQASPTISVNGDKVMVQGYVTDIAPGTKAYDVAARFPQGVPAVSDASQTEWMQYVYMQYPRPTNATGVPVTISVLDPNNNTYSVGTATSDANGYYSFTFTPKVEGQYILSTNFPGSKAYYGSTAETAINVENAPEATSQPVIQSNTSAYDAYFVPAVVAIIIAIAIVGMVMVLLLRKRA
jgi:hypothetical protein